MHAVAIQLAPVLGAEKSKVPFYIAGGVLVAWALVLSLGLGMRKPDFPGSLSGQRAVAAVTLVLVLGAVSTAVITSGTPAGSSKQVADSANKPSGSSPGSSPTNETSGSGSSTTPGSVAPEGSKSSPSSPPPSSPKATTGTPAPPSSPAAASTTLKLAANPAGQLAYNTKQLSAKAGKVTIDMANMSPIEHNVTIAEGSKVLGATPTFLGGTKALTLTLKPGSYTFYCSVPGHRQAGMEGTLTVS